MITKKEAIIIDECDAMLVYIKAHKPDDQFKQAMRIAFLKIKRLVKGERQ